MDGGICSQMHFYLVGRMLEASGNKVVYDLDWYKKVGKDLDGIHSRNFNLTELFPHLAIDCRLRAWERQVYVSAFYRHNDYFKSGSSSADWLGASAPLYFDGYFRDSEEMYGDLFRKSFAPSPLVFEGKDKATYTQITESPRPSCAIHVRRGDLSRFNTAYGLPPSPCYFKNAVEAVKKENGNAPVDFYIFSDEPHWCERNILPMLGAGRNVTIVDNNDSAKGYIDLALMSFCRHIIASQGSMGKYAALMRENMNQDGMVVLPPNPTSEEWLGRFRRAVIVRDC